MLADPLVACRDALLADPDVAAAVADRVYATPDLPQGHAYPCIRLTHIGTSGYAPVGFRQSASASVQLDAWATDMPTLHLIAEHVMDALTGRTADGMYIKPTFESRSLDEAVQPPLYRFRADLSARIVRADP
jgi:hypothetical protein